MEGSGEERDDDRGDSGVYAPPSVAADAPAPEKGAGKGLVKEGVPVPRISLAARVAVTAGATALWWGANQISLPGTDPEMFATPLRGWTKSTVSVVGLGITPVLVASSLVEVAALIVPRWRKLRHAGPAGREKLGRATALGALLFAAFQARSFAGVMAQASFFHGDPLMVAATLTTGTFLLWGIASAVSAWGLGNGVVWLFALEALSQLARIIGSEIAAGDTRVPLHRGLSALVVVATTWLVLRSAREAPALSAASSEKEPVYSLSIPAPASGFMAAVLATRLLVTMPVALLALNISLGSVPSNVGPLGIAILIALTSGLAVGSTYLFQRPSRVRAVLSRLHIEPASGGETFARDLVRLALPTTIVSQIALALCALLNVEAVMGLVLAAAWILDAVDAHRARREGLWVTVWTDERPFAAAAARAALARNGIELYTEGLLARTMLQFGTGYAPIRLQVREKDAARAGRYLREALPDPPKNGDVVGADPREAVSKEAVSKEGAGKKRGSKKKPLLPSRAVLGGVSRFVMRGLATAVLAGFIVTINRLVPATPARPSQLTEAQLAERRAAMQVVLLDDDEDPLESLATDPDVPKGVRFERENAPLGPGKTAPRYYAFAALQEGESVDALAARIQPWLEKIKVPPGTHFALEVVVRLEEETNRWETEGLRTMLLRDEAILTGADVVTARAAPETSGGAADSWKVMVEITKESADRFEKVTAANVKRRLAIVLSGRIESAPVVQTALKGGHFVITMGAGTPDDQKRNAQKLARVLSGED